MGRFDLFFNHRFWLNCWRRLGHVWLFVNRLFRLSILRLLVSRLLRLSVLRRLVSRLLRLSILRLLVSRLLRLGILRLLVSRLDWRPAFWRRRDGWVNGSWRRYGLPFHARRFHRRNRLSRIGCPYWG